MKKFIISSLDLFSASTYAYDDDPLSSKNTQALQQVVEMMNQANKKAGNEIAKNAPNVNTNHKTALTQINKYKIMKKNGASLRDLCYQSAVVREVFLNLGHETGYRDWNNVAAYNCHMSDSNPGL